MWLHLELLAEASSLLALPRESTFAALRTPPTEVRIEAGSPFCEHITYELPADQGTVLRRQYPVAPGLVDTIHRFKLHPHLAIELNETLVEYALHKETLADVALMEWSSRQENVNLHGREWVDAWLEDKELQNHPDVGVRKTNVGGYQSRDDAFVVSQDASDDDDGTDRKWGCRQLHRVCSEAVDAIGAKTCDAEGREAPGIAGAHSASAWFNVNREGSFNTLHIHDVGYWSAVYFVQDGAPRRASESDRGGGGGGQGGRQGGRQGVGQEVGQGDDAGAEHSAEGEPKAEGGLARHLVLRGGAQPHEAADLIGDELWQSEAAVTDAGPWQGGAGEGGGGAGRAEGSVAAAAAAAVQPASHSFLAVPPEPGTLWLFPGSVPHCVLGAMHVDDPLDRSSELDTPMEKEDEEARISVAINLTEAIAPPPHAYPSPRIA